MRLRGARAVFLAGVVFVLVAISPGSMGAGDECEATEAKIYLNPKPEPLFGAPGADAFNIHDDVVSFRLETEAPFVGAGEWRLEVVHETEGAVVTNHGTGFWAAGTSTTLDEQLEDETSEPPSGGYKLEFSHTGAYTPFEATLTTVRCPA